MKQTPNNQIPPTQKSAEELLLHGVDTKLTMSEQSEMWSHLKAYAEFHAPSNVVPDKKYLLTSVRLLTGAFASLLLLVGTGVASSNSLPGDFLYPVKVDVTERALGLIQFSDIQKLEYQSEIFHHRLDEIKELSKIKRLSEVEILIIESEMSERSEDIQTILRESEKLSIEENDSVRILSDILSDVKTHKYIEDTVLGTARTSKIDGIEESISALYLSEISDFVTESPEDVNLYIEESLSTINSYVEESANQNELEVRDYLVDVAEALQVNDIEKAIYYIGEAEQVIEFNAEVDSLNDTVDEEETE